MTPQYLSFPDFQTPQRLELPLRRWAAQKRYLGSSGVNGIRVATGSYLAEEQKELEMNRWSAFFVGCLVAIATRNQVSGFEDPNLSIAQKPLVCSAKRDARSCLSLSAATCWIVLRYSLYKYSPLQVHISPLIHKKSVGTRRTRTPNSGRCSPPLAL